MWDIGHATIPMPGFSIIYIKKTGRTPRSTAITLTFPDGQAVAYESENVILEAFTKEYIAEKRLFPYIPFYIALKSSAKKVELASVDDLFSTEESRADGGAGKGGRNSFKRAALVQGAPIQSQRR